jgi:glutathione S-transferase
MLTIHGIPISVHTRKVIVVARLKGLQHRVEPVIPFQPPAHWTELSPTGLIPAIEDDGFTLADSSAIALYLERKHPATPVLPTEPQALGRALWFDGYAGGTVFRHVIHGLFVQKVIRPGILGEPTDQGVIDQIRATTEPKVFRYLDDAVAAAGGRFLVGGAFGLADIAITSNLINYQYLGYRIDAARHPHLARYARERIGDDVLQQALAAERPFVEQMGLDRGFIG